MSSEALFKNILNIFKAIEFCIENKYFLPSLTLLYSGIDFMAWLDRPKSKPDVQGSDFIGWVEKYLLSDSGISCNGADLYSARCAIIHSYTAESKKTREGKAQKVYYCWGEAKVEDLQELINFKGNSSTVALHIEELFKSFRKAYASFAKEIIKDYKKMMIIIQRSDKILANLPPLKIKK